MALPLVPNTSSALGAVGKLLQRRRQQKRGLAPADPNLPTVTAREQQGGMSQAAVNVVRSTPQVAGPLSTLPDQQIGGVNGTGLQPATDLQGGGPKPKKRKKLGDAPGSLSQSVI